MSYRSKPWTTTDPDLSGPDPRDGGGNDAAEGRETDVLFEVLSHEYRRAAIRHLAPQEEAIDLDDLLAAVVDACESGGDDDRRPMNRRARVEAGFHHAHLGKLRDAGMVVYDPNHETVRPTERAVHAAHVLDGL